MNDLGISNTLVSMNLQCEATLSENNLALSQTLQMFCTEAFKPSMLIGAAAANFCGSLLGFKAFSLCSKLFGSSAFATKAITFSAKVIGEGTMFHIAPELLETRSLQTANLLRGSASSTLMVAFSQAAGKFGGGFLVQQMFQDVAVLCSQDLSAYLGWSEVQTGGVYNRLLYAQISSCQMQVGAGVVHLTCHEITMMNAKISLDQSFQKAPTRRSDLSQGWLQSARNFFATPHAEVMTPEGIAIPLSRLASQQPWQIKSAYIAAMSLLKGDGAKPSASRGLATSQHSEPIKFDLDSERERLPNILTRLAEAREVIKRTQKLEKKHGRLKTVEKALQRMETVSGKVWKLGEGEFLTEGEIRVWEALKRMIDKPLDSSIPPLENNPKTKIDLLYDQVMEVLLTLEPESDLPIPLSETTEVSRVPRTDRTVESILRNSVIDARVAYSEEVARFNQRRKDPTNPEHQMLHISETKGFQAIQQAYYRAIENFFFWINATPRSWKGEIFPELHFRREGEDLLIEPPHWKASNELSLSHLWSFLLQDTIGSAQIVRRLHEMGFDQKIASDLYLMMHGAWGERCLVKINGRLRLSGAQNLIDAAGDAAIIAPTHDSALEFPIIPRVLQDYGFRVFIMADKKFFTSFPHPPTFGLLRALLGPMDEYGHLMVDRGDKRVAIASMDDAGKRIKSTKDSILIFPQGTRRRVVGKGLARQEDPDTYGVKTGVAKIMEVSQAPIIPIGMINGARIFPAQAGQAFLSEGVLLGQEYGMVIGAPLVYSNLIPGKKEPKGTALREAVTQQLNNQIAQLTHRRIGPPAESKDKRLKKKKV